MTRVLRGRALRRTLVLLSAVAMLATVATLRLFVLPPSATPVRADAVVVLSGDRGERFAEATRLLNAGVGRTLVLAGKPDSLGVRNLCVHPPRHVSVVCLRPNPDNTATEARSIGRLVQARGWRDLAVVTSTYHVARAGLLIRRCTDANVQMVVAHPQISGWQWIRQIVHEWGGVGKAEVLRRDC